MKTTRTLASFCFLLLIFCLNALATDKQPWEGKPFSVDAKEMLKAAGTITAAKDADVETLYSASRYVFAANGSHTWTRHSIYRIVNQAGTQDLNKMQVEYQPWHNKRPELRARVISPDGTVHELDPKTITEGPAKDEDDEEIFTDDRRVRAPLPAIAPGVIVEEFITIEEDKPSFEWGLVFRDYFQSGYPIHHRRLEVDAPSSMDLHFITQLLPKATTEKNASNGRTAWIYTNEFMEATKDIENFTPPEVALYPAVQFTTGTSWADLAKHYNQAVDEKIASSDLKAIVTKTVPGKDTREEKITALMAWLHQEIRYTGIEFGQAAYIPVTPAETLKRKFGDCKDKSTFLVAMLRAAGIPANLALLETGPGPDLLSELPGMGIFDHAIVHVPGSPEFWIDATAEYMPLGVVPSADQGRKALIISTETTGLTMISESKSSENVTSELREFYLAEDGPSRVVETVSVKGGLESEYRGYYDDSNKKDVKKSLDD